MVLDFDLNDPPPCGDNFNDIPFRGVDPLELQDEQPLQSQQQAIIDIEAIDDDVVPSSPRTFYEARSKSRRGLELIVVHDEDTLHKGSFTSLELSFPETIWFLQSRDKRRRILPQEKDDNREHCRNKETFHSSEFPPSVPPQGVPAFTCPVCMGQLVKETTTKCGHIFCEECIKAAIAVQHKCPTCRKKLTVRSTHRIYLPAAS